AERVYVADAENHRIQVFKPDGTSLFSVGSYGSKEGQCKKPLDVASDHNGNIYVTDTYNHRIQKSDSKGRFLKAWGKWGSHAGLFAEPSSIACHDNDLYVTDLINH